MIVQALYNRIYWWLMMIILYYYISYYCVLYYIVLYCIILYYLILCYLILYYITLYHIILYYIKLYYIIYIYISLLPPYPIHPSNRQWILCSECEAIQGYLEVLLIYPQHKHWDAWRATFGMCHSVATCLVQWSDWFLFPSQDISQALDRCGL